ncbi:saccharopine dehydrogenase NADP-binding domain-containing protein [Sporomusa sphaeroides]|uniref:Saccharopine dehydrogenase n=1 Tax=Sporomusa sphaeroides DSM 2875 TaxID=1337886 RepID=A0ABP2CCI1_9FIRM|nr:saccharopine dehydrogenase NADP-binding domain-containing protein [Sporomusa sphaeroides]OLS57253.1 saccharopine dehydrogenase [Sporomusa sphaeroides DSM 2875]CVK20155.1 Saccharopine dehydrogenase [Sporomusa sphaeroides DSM 2875]
MIGIIGGYGAVGLQTARMLQEWGGQPLRIGGRNSTMARNRFSGEFPRAEWFEVDVEDDQSMDLFLDGCSLIVNCSGPSWRTAARVARMCLARGCHHVDAGMDKEMAVLRKTTPNNTVVLYAAGATPGLSGLLPRQLAQAFDQVESLRYYTGALDKFTAAAAEDYLTGVVDKDNQPLAGWKDSACRLAALNRRTGTRLPFFPREVTLYPYFDAEAEFVANALALRDGEWYIGIDGQHVPPVLDEVRFRFSTNRHDAIKRLCTAAELDAAGRRQYALFIIELSGRKNGTGITRTLVLQADRPSLLTGSVAAAAAIAVLEGEIPAGIRPLAELPVPDKVIERLNKSKVISCLRVFESSVEQLLPVTEGEL